MSEILRWFLVLPGALVFVGLSMFPIHWVVVLVQLFGKANDDALISIRGKGLLAAIPPDVLERFGYAFFTPLVLISTAAWIAPRLKMQTGVAFPVLWGIGFGAAITYLLSRVQPVGWQWFQLGLTCLLAIAGVISGLSRARKLAR